VHMPAATKADLVRNLTITPRQLAAMLAVTEHELWRWRRDGHGPPWTRLLPSRRIRYRLAEVKAWIAQSSSR
jgi:predicted DNA-binding transcriptional regulator AlpA